jgi:hypothetical protein
VNELVKATNLNPLNFEYSLSLAKALWEDGRLDTTILQYKYAETITTTDAQRAIVYYFMAQVYQQMGNTSKESQAWRFLLDLPVDQVPADWRILALERWYFLNPDVPTETPQDSQVPLITETPTRTPIPTITRHPTQTPLTINTSAPTPNE